MRRLEPIVLGLERALKPVVIVAHQAPCRALRAYLLGLPLAPSLVRVRVSVSVRMRVRVTG